MQKNGFHGKPLHRFLLLVFLSGFLILAFDYLGFFEGLNNYCYDLYFRLQPTAAVNKRIILITVDEESLLKLGRWPIARKYYAELLNRLKLADVVGFDILFDEPSSDDAVFRAAIRRHGRVVLVAHVDRYLQVKLPVFYRDAAALGHVHIDLDVDGEARYVFNEIATGNTELPSLAKAMADFGRKPDYSSQLRTANGYIRQSERMGINYYGDVFQRLALDDVLAGDHFSQAFFSRKLVLVGVTASGLVDRYSTPVSAKGRGMAGVVLQATILNNILNHSGMIRVPQWQALSIFLLFYIVTLWAAFFFRRQGLVFFPTIAFLVLLFSFVAHRWFYVWIGPAPFLLACLTGFICVWVLRLELMSRQLSLANREWQDSFDSMTDAVFIYGLAGTLVKENSVAKSFHHGIAADILAERSRLLLAGDEVQDKAQIADPDLNKHLEIRSWRRLDENQRLLGVMHVVADVTEKKLMEIKEAALQAQLITAQRMEAIASLAGGVAHDFNNVLSAILGYGELLALALSEQPDLHDKVCIILEAGERGATLARQLLLFSRKKQTTKQAVDLGTLTENMVKMLTRILGNNIKIVLELNPGQAPIFADPGQIDQVLMNLVVNARDAMPEGGVLSILVDEYTALEDEMLNSGMLRAGRYMRMTVSDTGEGIAPEQLGHIFEPFYSTKEEGKGTGLGLATVFRIIEQHQGGIAVASEIGLGTSFMVYLPRGKEAVRQGTAALVPVMPRGRETILLAEHNPLLGTMLGDILNSLGYNVILRPKGSDAVAFGSKNSFDLLITEVIMPDMSGKEIGQLLRHIKPAIKILYISGYPEEALSRYGEWLPGKEFFMQKPITSAMLAAKIRAILDD